MAGNLLPACGAVGNTRIWWHPGCGCGPAWSGGPESRSTAGHVEPQLFRDFSATADQGLSALRRPAVGAARALDAAFNTADLPMMLRMGDMDPRYRQHFLRH